MGPEVRKWRAFGRAAVRWAGRVYALLLIGLVLLLAVGEGVDFSALTPQEMACMVAFGVALVGLLAAWRWELAGGLMTVGGMVAFGLVGVIARGRWGWRGWVFWSVAITGAAFCALGLLGRRCAATPRAVNGESMREKAA